MARPAAEFGQGIPLCGGLRAGDVHATVHRLCGGGPFVVGIAPEVLPVCLCRRGSERAFVLAVVFLCARILGAGGAGSRLSIVAHLDDAAHGGAGAVGRGLSFDGHLVRVGGVVHLSRTEMPTAAKRLLLLWIVVPVPLVMLANTLFHYFFAIRQLLFIVPPLCVLAGEGLEALQRGWRPLVAVALLAAACVYDVRWFGHSKEDWQLPAAAARRLVVPGTCVFAAPRSAADLYRLYEPSLPFCAADSPGKASVLLVSPYATEEDREAVTNAAFPPIELGGSEVRQMAR